MSKPPVDLSIAVKRHHDPTVERQVCVICPRRKGKAQEGKAPERGSGATPVTLSLEFLRPLFKKPLTVVSKELGLSATAIKKACRRFGVPKWPFRTLTAKTSRNRTYIESSGSRPAAPAFNPSLPSKETYDVVASQGVAGIVPMPSCSQVLKQETHQLLQLPPIVGMSDASGKEKNPAQRAAPQTDEERKKFALDEQELLAARSLSLLSEGSR
eukprot:CAMPEP_0196748276 /NCGR_PEP_ID=MMETSP1091-20130531/72962_1 /TAXON_ID=302021 /ORGANISM="Rhodomonas sp., Strain CCMP768" /LENGTH=212 /DNA_ID=CAMNT_0042095563 /DNA_START=22 /DNA_END=660 /DNA_ORIENTATION=+